MFRRFESAGGPYSCHAGSSLLNILGQPEKAGLPQSQEAQQMVGFEGCFEASGLDTTFASPWSAQEGQGEVAEGDPVLAGISEFYLRGIIAEYHVQQPVQAILNAPMQM